MAVSPDVLTAIRELTRGGVHAAMDTSGAASARARTTPSIVAFAKDGGKQNDPVWQPIFEGYEPVQAWFREKQPDVLESVVSQVVGGNSSISGVMIESNLEAGSQKISADPADLKYGVSITDACIDWATTERILLDAHKKLQKRK